MKDELISRTTRGLFRSLMTGSTLGEISTAFEDEGFVPDPGRKTRTAASAGGSTQAYLDAIDWSDPRRVMLALQVSRKADARFRGKLHRAVPAARSGGTARRRPFQRAYQRGRTAVRCGVACRPEGPERDQGAARPKESSAPSLMTPPSPSVARRSSSRAPPRSSWPSGALR